MNESVQARQEINLYALEFHRGDQAFSFAFISRCCIAFFVALLLVEGFTTWLFWQQQDQLVKLRASEQQINVRLTALKQAQPLSQRPKLESQLTKLQQQVQQRQELQRIMGGQEFGNFDGFSPFLVGLARRANANVSLTHIYLQDGGKALQLRGWTRVPEAVPQYLQDLRQENSLENVRLGVLAIEKDPQHSHKLKFSVGDVKSNKRGDSSS